MTVILQAQHNKYMSHDKEGATYERTSCVFCTKWDEKRGSPLIIDSESCRITMTKGEGYNLNTVHQARTATTG